MVEYPYTGVKRWCVCEILWCSPLTLSPHPRFESVQYAQKAKAALNGADIYAGCCTLKIEYARVSSNICSTNSELYGRLFPTKCNKVSEI